MSRARSRNACRFMLIPYFRITPIPPGRPVTRQRWLGCLWPKVAFTRGWNSLGTAKLSAFSPLPSSSSPFAIFCPICFSKKSSAWLCSPGLVITTQLAPTTFRGCPSESILHSPAHSPRLLLSGTATSGTPFSKHSPEISFLYAGSLQLSASKQATAWPASIAFADSCSPRITPSTAKAFFSTRLTAPETSDTSSSTSSTSTSTSATSSSRSAMAELDNR
mmetsp:Transcript_5792/g.14314  ORF Transcript_5792/g.14314 Transcript_5792/m.14314 type:complete len:220 (-) Transcript_5792:30-689(-)